MYLQLERSPGLQWLLFSEVHGLEPEEGGMPYDTAEISFADLLLSLTNTLIAEATYIVSKELNPNPNFNCMRLFRGDNSRQILKIY